MPEMGSFIPSFLLYALPLLLFLFQIFKILSSKSSAKNTTADFAKSYPLIGHLLTLRQHKHDRFKWLSSLIVSSPTSTITINRPFGHKMIVTGNKANVEHMLKTKFHIYQIGDFQKSILRDIWGNGILNVDGEEWKFQRKVASNEFSTKSLRKFVEKVVDYEMSNRLIPLLEDAAKNQTVLELQDILHRFAFDTICKIAFDYDPEYLTSSLPESKFYTAFEDAALLTVLRFRTLFPRSWKIFRFLNFGSEKKLSEAVSEIRGFAQTMIRKKKDEILKNSEAASTAGPEDLLSRFLKFGHMDDKQITDIVINFTVAGRETTPSSLTWFFWVMHKNKEAQEKIVDEVNDKRSRTTQDYSAYDEAKELVYTHAAIHESMRIFPPVAIDTKEAISDDVLPDGTPVKKGSWVVYYPYAMGRLESLWGSDWADYKPERWLVPKTAEDPGEGKWKFVPRDPYSYPVFHAGPRVCLGKEMALLQIKSVIAGVLQRFRVVPAFEDGYEPEYYPSVTAQMKGGFPVRIEERVPTQ